VQRQHIRIEEEGEEIDFKKKDIFAKNRNWTSRK
jgi:hypothetical protein